MIEVQADMVASVLRVYVESGSEVNAGDILLLLESMKMEIPVIAEVDGLVGTLRVEPGLVVQEGDVLLTIDSR